MHEWELLNAVVALQSHQLVTALSSLCPPQPGVCFTADPDAKCFQWKHLPTSRTVFTARHMASSYCCVSSNAFPGYLPKNCLWC